MDYGKYTMSFALCATPLHTVSRHVKLHWQVTPFYFQPMARYTPRQQRAQELMFSCLTSLLQFLVGFAGLAFLLVFAITLVPTTV
jgi:hypothetical protein